MIVTPEDRAIQIEKKLRSWEENQMMWRLAKIAAYASAGIGFLLLLGSVLR